MHPNLNGITTEGLIRPDETYIITEFEERGHLVDPLDIMYIIKSEDEIVPALEMQMFIILKSFYDFKAYLGCEKMSDDCYAFKMQCVDKADEEDCICYLYLHRLTTFKERLQNLNQLGA
jgi:hypothetical protein